MNCFVKCVQILDIIMQLVEYFQDAHFNSTKFNAIWIVDTGIASRMKKGLQNTVMYIVKIFV
jgi:hypothetical protein